MVKKKNKSLKYDDEKPPLGLLDSYALEAIAKVSGFGAKKYGKDNWRGGLEWSRVISAALRHLLAFNSGEDLDKESGLSHLAHAGCCIMFLLWYSKYKQEKDDRYKYDKRSS